MGVVASSHQTRECQSLTQVVSTRMLYMFRYGTFRYGTFYDVAAKVERK
jgi:hypothetical protein